MYCCVVGMQTLTTHKGDIVGHIFMQLLFFVKMVIHIWWHGGEIIERINIVLPLRGTNTLFCI